MSIDGVINGIGAAVCVIGGIIVALALLMIGYMVFAAIRDGKAAMTQLEACRAANPGYECVVGFVRAAEPYKASR